MSIPRKSAAIATCLALAAGGGTAAVLATSAGASTVPGSTGTGTATVSVTGPADKTHTATRPIVCKVDQGRYVVRSVARGAKSASADAASRSVSADRRGTADQRGKADKARHHRRGARLRFVVRDYNGPGNYTGTAVIRHHRYTVPVTLTSTGGSITYTKTLSGKHDPANTGKTISLDATWTCSS